MTNKDLKEILLATGSSDIAVRKEVVKNVLYKASNLLATGTRLVPVNNYNVLDISMTFPDEGVVAEYPVPEGANAPETALTWTDFHYPLKKAEVRMTINDEAILRGIAQQQNRRSFQRAAESLAKKKDGNILGVCFAGAGQTQTVANAWDTAMGDPAGDIVSAWGLLLENTNISDAESQRMWGVFPPEAYTLLMKLQEINNINQKLKDWLEQSFGINIVPSRDSSIAGTGMLIVNSDETAEHGVLSTNEIPLSESERLTGVGTRWTIRQYFNTKVVPESDSVATNKRIVKFGTTVT
jgi:hypothetical protein